MLKIRHLFLTLAVLVAFVPDSQGQSSRHQAPANQAPKTEQSAAPEQRGTPDKPLTVNVVPTAEQKAAAAKDAAEAEIKTANEGRLIQYTRDQVIVGIVSFLIFLLQLVAFVAQACYMRRSYIEMRRTTHANIRSTRAAQRAATASTRQAKAAEDALTLLERPYIFIFGVHRFDFDDETKEWFVEYTVANYGKMPGIIEMPHIGFVIDNQARPPVSPLMEEDHTLMTAPIMEAGERRKIREYLPDGMSDGDIIVDLDGDGKGTNVRTSPVINEDNGMMTFFRGVIHYSGPFTRGHETSATWWYFRERQEFVSRGGSEYNYVK
jgi:hypothetical protein